MANIRLDLQYPIVEGQTLTFKSPANCTSVGGLIVYYPEGGNVVSKEFQFADAHGNNIGDLDLFASDTLVKVILHLASSLAFVQNADTNAYIEHNFLKKSNANDSDWFVNMSGHTFTNLPAPKNSSEPANKDYVDSHINNKGNPHDITASQIGALPMSGGTVSGNMTFNGMLILGSLNSGSSLPTAGIKGRIFFKKVSS